MPELAQLTGTATDLHLFIPITRVDDEERVVEGYCFVNEVVDGEGGIRLLRSAMEAATEDYMRWGAVREMHQASAVGTALADGCGITWDEKGAKLRAKIVDEAAWRKVKEGVYRGFSLGASPKLIRGKNVEKVSWVENSLVDRPKDPSCPFTLFRREDGEEGSEAVIDRSAEAVKGYLVGLKDPGAEDEPFITRVLELLDQPYEARVVREGDHPDMQVLTASEVALAAHLARAQTSETVPSRENLEGSPKGDTHYDCGQGSSSYCHGHTTRGGAQECQEKTTAAKAEHVAALEGHLAAMKAGQRGEGVGEALDFLRTRLTEAYGEGPETEFLTRVAEILTEQEPPTEDPAPEERAETALLSRFDEVLTRLDAAEAETAAVRGELTSAKEQIEKLKCEPADRHRPPVRFPQALERTFNTGEPARDSAADQALLEEWKRLTTGPAAADPEEQLLRVRRIQELKPEVYALGLLGRE